MEPQSNRPLLDRVLSPKDLRQLPVADLERLSNELRGELIDQVSKTGGHLGASLGVVELTVALHYVFDTPYDRLIWDVGHQCYPHKILTGRRALMPSLRKADGLSGFTRRSESDYDPFGAAHSSTSISAGLGMAVAAKAASDKRRVVCVIGDGALGAGMAYEALNNLGEQKQNLTIILNDNAMSIGPAVGSISSHLAALLSSAPLQDAKSLARSISKRMPSPLRQAMTAMHGIARELVAPSNIFESLGVDYFGPVDGHKVQDLVQILHNLRDIEGPVLLHTVTRKGKGYAPAEESGDKFHGVSKFNVATGAPLATSAAAPKSSYTKVFANTLCKAASKDASIFAITAAMGDGTGLVKFRDLYPDRYFDVGIAEQHAVTFAAGLASQGMRPMVAIYSTFLQRAYDQIVHDVAIQGLPVRFAIDRAGLVGADGATHAGSYDIAYLGCLPGMVLMAPADEGELARMIMTSLAIDDRPSAVRFPRGSGPRGSGVASPSTLEIGRARMVREGSDGAIISYGCRLAAALEAAEMFAADGKSISVVDARFAKPIDQDMIARLAAGQPWLASVEAGSIGGFASQVMMALNKANSKNNTASKARFIPICLPDFFIDHADPAEQYALAGLDGKGIFKQISQQIK